MDYHGQDYSWTSCSSKRENRNLSRMRAATLLIDLAEITGSVGINEMGHSNKIIL